MKLVCRGPSVADVLWTTNTTACDRVLLTSDIWSLGNIGGRRSRTQLEDRRVPSVTLLAKLLVLGSLGRDTTWQLDVGEDRVVLGHGNVHLLIGGNSLCLLLSLGAVDESLLLSRVLDEAFSFCFPWGLWMEALVLAVFLRGCG